MVSQCSERSGKKSFVSLPLQEPKALPKAFLRVKFSACVKTPDGSPANRSILIPLPMLAKDA